MARILLVEDCPDTQALVRGTLAHHDVVWAGSLVRAREELERRAFDLVLLDLALPDGGGFSLGAQLRADPALRQVPLIFLTDSHEARAEVMALGLGAADAVEKPFQPVELRARVDARLRSATRPRSDLLELGALLLDPVLHRVTRREGANSVEIALTPHEFELLRVLAEHSGEVVLRSLILERVWRNVAVGRRTVDTHVSNLRRKIGRARLEIEAVRGVGYRVRVEPEGAPPQRQD